MNDKANLHYRALGAFAAMGSLPDRLVAAAEDTLFEAEAGVSRPPRLTSPFRRFLHSGWSVAAAVGLVVLGTLAFVLGTGSGAGSNSPTYTNPPVASPIPASKQEAEFTIRTDKDIYNEGEEIIIATMTGKHSGESIRADNAWYLEKIESTATEVAYYTYPDDIVLVEAADENSYATISRQIRVNYGLESGHYRLHATRYNPQTEQFESVATCEFSVYEPETEFAEWDNPNFNFNMKPEQDVYPDMPISVTVLLIRRDTTEPFELPDAWYLQKENQTGKTSIEILNVEIREPSDTVAVVTIYPKVLADSGLQPGVYILQAHIDNVGTSHCRFEVGEPEVLTEQDTENTDSRNDFSPD